MADSAVLVPYADATSGRTLGLAEGEVRIAEDFDELPGDLAGAFGVSR